MLKCRCFEMLGNNTGLPNTDYRHRLANTDY